MEDKLFHEELRYHYSDGKLSLQVDMEKNNFKRC